MNEVKRDTQFVPIVLTDAKGKRQAAFLYKPQRLIVRSYITEELARALGYKIEEVNHDTRRIY